MEESLLKFYSLGIVVETKPPNTDIILVTPIEKLNIQEPGPIKDKKYKSEGKLKSITSVNFETEINSKNYLRAKWLPLSNSNRITAPDVVANETVILFKYQNVDEYYWTTIFREPELRRLETVNYSYSNLRSGITAFDKTTSYWTEVDTRNKKIHVHTSMNDGEYTEYDIDIDTKNGILYISDKKGNIIKLISKEDKILVNTNNDVTINTAKTVNITTGTTINIVANSSVNITSPNINLNGNVSVNGSLNTSGNTQSKGSIQCAGNIQCKGNINCDGSIIDVGGNTNHHTH